jgi:hypothetical protein
VFANNMDNGIDIDATATNYVLDFGTATSAGNNSIYGNNMSHGGNVGLSNSGNGTVDAAGNWWGKRTPVAGTDYTDGKVNAANPLTSDPNAVY